MDMCVCVKKNLWGKEAALHRCMHVQVGRGLPLGTIIAHMHAMCRTRLTSIGPHGLGGTHCASSGTSYGPEAGADTDSMSRNASPHTAGSKPSVTSTSTPAGPAGGATTTAGASKPLLLSSMPLETLPVPLRKLQRYSVRSGSQCRNRKTCVGAVIMEGVGAAVLMWHCCVRPTHINRCTRAHKHTLLHVSQHPHDKHIHG